VTTGLSCRGLAKPSCSPPLIQFPPPLPHFCPSLAPGAAGWALPARGVSQAAGGGPGRRHGASRTRTEGCRPGPRPQTPLCAGKAQPPAAEHRPTQRNPDLGPPLPGRAALTGGPARAGRPPASTSGSRGEGAVLDWRKARGASGACAQLPGTSGGGHGDGGGQVGPGWGEGRAGPGRAAPGSRARRSSLPPALPPHGAPAAAGLVNGCGILPSGPDNLSVLRRFASPLSAAQAPAEHWRAGGWGTQPVAEEKRRRGLRGDDFLTPVWVFLGARNAFPPPPSWYREGRWLFCVTTGGVPLSGSEVQQLVLLDVASSNAPEAAACSNRTRKVNSRSYSWAWPTPRQSPGACWLLPVTCNEPCQLPARCAFVAPFPRPAAVISLENFSCVIVFLLLSPSSVSDWKGCIVVRSSIQLPHSSGVSRFLMTSVYFFTLFSV